MKKWMLPLTCALALSACGMTDTQDSAPTTGASSTMGTSSSAPADTSGSSTGATTETTNVYESGMKNKDQTGAPVGPETSQASPTGSISDPSGIPVGSSPDGAASGDSGSTGSTGTGTSGTGSTGAK